MNQPLQPDISFVLPVYNAAEFIEETLHSLVDESINNKLDKEFIIINDGSTDNSDQIITEFINVHQEQKFIYRKRINRGVSFSRNEGLELSSGQFISFVDSDDIVPFESIISLVQAIELENSYDGAAASAICFTSDRSNHVNYLKSVSSPTDLLMSKAGYITCPSGYIWKRSFLMENGIRYNLKLSSSADKEFLLTALSVGKVKSLDTTKYFYRVSENSMSNRITEHLVLDKLTYIKEILPALETYAQFKRDYVASQYYAAGGMAFKIQCYREAAKLLAKAFIVSPKRVYHLIFN